MNIGSMIVTFFCAVLYGILSGDSDTGMVSLIFCVPVTLICTIVGLIKSEGKTKLLVIPVQIVIWAVCALLGVHIFKGMIAIAILGIGALVLFHFFGNIFGSGNKDADEEIKVQQDPAFADRLPNELIDEEGNHWFRDYTGSNVVRYHCNTNGQSTELYEGQTNVYSNRAVGNDGREYHWN